MSVKYPVFSELTADVLTESEGEHTCISCISDGGKIVPTGTFELVTPIEDFAYVPYFAFYSVPLGKFLICGGGNLFTADAAGNFFHTNYEFMASKPFMIECKKKDGNAAKSYLFGNDFYIEISSGVIAHREARLKFRHGVFKNGRLFAIDGENAFVLRWSAPNDVLNFDKSVMGSGEVFINHEFGEMLNLAVLDDKVVALCENGLAVMTAYGDPENFKLTYPRAKLGKICSGTCAAVCGKLVFFADSELYSFDGREVTKIDFDYSGDLSSPTCATSLGEWYFVNGTSARLGKKVVLAVNAVTKKCYYIIFEAKALCAFDSVYAVDKRGVFKLTDCASYTYESGEIDFGKGSEKLLKSLHIGTEQGVDVTVTNGQKSRILRGVRGYCRVNMRGKRFKIKLRSNKKICGVLAFGEALSDV